MKQKPVSLANASEKEMVEELRRRDIDVVMLTSPRKRKRQMHFYGDAVVCAFLCSYALHYLHRHMMETER